MSFKKIYTVGLASVACGASMLGAMTPAMSAHATTTPAIVNSVQNAAASVYPHHWAPDSPAYRTMPANAPIDPNSSSIVNNIVKYGIQYYGDKTNNIPSMTLNIHSYSNPLITAHNSDPSYDIKFTDCQNKGSEDTNWENLMKGVHIPDSAKPSNGSDGQMSLYNADSGRYVELWQASKTGNTWSACWGGNINNTATSNTQFQNPYGVSAAGIAYEPYTIKAAELQAGRIDHPVALSLPPEVVNSFISGIADRTDGALDPNTPNTISEGQYLRLPKSLDVDSLHLTRVANIIAHAAQDYGLIISDRGYDIGFAVENSNTFATDPYPALFQGFEDYSVMWGNGGTYKAFPFSSLQVVQRGYLPPVTTTTNVAAEMTSPIYQANGSAKTLLSKYSNETNNAAQFGFNQNLGNTFDASTTAQAGLTPVHRLYKASSGDFAYLAEGTEMNAAESKYGYVDNGIGFYASTTPQNNTVPLYSLGKGSNHEYTISVDTKNSLVSSGWSQGTTLYVTKPTH